MPLIVTCLEDSGQSRCLADLHAASSEHPAPESRLTATPGAALTRTRGLRSSRDRLGGCGGTARKGGGQGLGRLTDILAVTPKDSSDEQRQQHQRLGSPEADHGSPRGPAAERSAGRRHEHGVGAGLTAPSCRRPEEQEEEAGDPAAQRRSASSPRRGARYMRRAPLEAGELAQTAGRPRPPAGL